MSWSTRQIRGQTPTISCSAGSNAELAIDWALQLAYFGCNYARFAKHAISPNQTITRLSRERVREARYCELHCGPQPICQGGLSIVGVRNTTLSAWLVACSRWGERGREGGKHTQTEETHTHTPSCGGGGKHNVASAMETAPWGASRFAAPPAPDELAVVNAVKRRGDAAGCREPRRYRG